MPFARFLRVSAGTRLAIAWLVSAVVVIGAPSSFADVVNRPSDDPRIDAIAPGVTYRRIRLRGPAVVHVVRIDPARPSSIDAAAGGPRMGSFARPSAIGRAHGALVAINGDFGLFRGMPLHAFQADGTLLARGIHTGTSFAMSQDEEASFLDTTRLSIAGQHPVGGSTFGVHGWNSHRPDRGAIAAFTRYGGEVRRPPRVGCAARLTPDSPWSWGPDAVGVTRRYAVEANRCRPKRMRVDPRTVVLASRRWGAGSDALAAMAHGERVRLTWSFGWRQVADSVGGVPRLVDDGRVVAPTCGTSFCRRHPRTGVGVADDRAVLFVVVDGRSHSSVGMTLARFGRTFASLGAVEAVNLDGGGSSAMWIAGRGIVNRPSDPGGERPTVNALLLLPGLDPGERPHAAGDPAVARGLGDAAAAGALAALDPGSTGGLAEAWAAGWMADAPPPPAIARIAARFARGS